MTTKHHPCHFLIYFLTCLPHGRFSFWQPYVERSGTTTCLSTNFGIRCSYQLVIRANMPWVHLLANEYIVVTITVSNFKIIRGKLSWTVKMVTSKVMACNAYSKMCYRITSPRGYWGTSQMNTLKHQHRITSYGFIWSITSGAYVMNLEVITLESTIITNLTVLDGKHGLVGWNYMNYNPWKVISFM